MAVQKDYRETLETSGQTIVGDSLAESITFNAQCFLIQNMFDIAPKAEEKLGLFIERLRNDTETDPHSTSQASGYNYVAPLLSDTAYTAPKTFSKLVQPREAIRMLDLTTDKMAMLVPCLRIYKVEYESLPPDDEGFRRPNLNLAKDKEIIFDDFVSEQTLERMFERHQGRLAGTGIKSFKWSLKGVNPADVDKNIEAQLTVHFNDVSALFTDNTRHSVYKAGRPGGSSFLDLIIYAPHKALATTGDAESGNAQDTETVPSYLHYDGAFFEIKAEVGWQVPPNHGSFFTSKEMDVIRDTRTPLYLQLTQHRFNFNQDGSADLVIDYRARYGSLENRFDILGIPEDLDLITNLAKLEKSRESLGQSPPRPTAAQRAPFDDANQQVEAAQKLLNDYLEERYSRIFTYLISRNHLLDVFAKPLQLRAFSQAPGTGAPAEMSIEDYRQMTERAQAAHTTDSPVSEAHLAGGATGSEPFFQYMFGRTTYYEGLRQDGFFGYNGEVVHHADLVSIQTEHGLYRKRLEEALENDPDSKDALGISMAGMGSPRTPGTPWSRFTAHGAAEGVRPNTSGDQQPNPMEDPNLGKDKIPVTFFLLGDLIEGVIEEGNKGGVKKEIDMQRMGLVTTDLEFMNVKVFYDAATAFKPADPEAGTRTQSRNPEQFFKKLKFRELSFSRQDKQRLFKTINIASIPIQYESFVNWYIKKVVKPKKPRYYFNHFIADVLRDLVMPMLSAKCFYGMPQRQYHFTQLDILADRDGVFAKALYSDGVPPLTNSVFTSGLVARRALPLSISIGKQGTRHLDKPAAKNIHRNFKILLMTDPGMMEFELGDEDSDREKGIYHFIVGADRGLLKTATFQRTDAPYLREARINRDRVAGAEQLRELYSVTLKLYGAPLIKPGQYIYVSPAPIGFGTPKNRNSPARYLGIGGYHLVTSVENTISQKGYETIVKALHQAMPYIDPGKNLVNT